MENATPKGGAVLLGGERAFPTKFTLPQQPFDDLARYRALSLMQSLSVRPELAATLASLAFGGGK